MCLWSEFFKTEGENTTSNKLSYYVKIILGKSFWASLKLFENHVTDNISNAIFKICVTTISGSGEGYETSVLKSLGNLDEQSDKC